MSVSLQINITPSDYMHVRHILKHQLAILSRQVSEIILTIDTIPSKGRFSEGWTKNKEKLYAFISNEIEPFFNVKVIPVDYSKDIREEIAQFFFGQKFIPQKDFRGGPFYAYFHGLYTASNDIVFHLDSDMFLGGKSQLWIKEAITYFETDRDCLIVSPLPGPPHVKELLIGQTIICKLSPYTYQLAGMSTRVFMINKSKFKNDKITLSKPNIRGQLKALIEKNSNADLPEHLIANFMLKHKLKRIDFLGTGKGMWSLHPPFRTKKFYDILPNLIQEIETGSLSVEQAGFYDIIDKVCDWGEAREKIKKNRWWKRLLKF